MDFEARTISLRDGARVRLRPGDASDAAANLAFVTRSVPESPFILTTPDEIWSADEIRERLERVAGGEGVVIFAEPEDEPGRIVACLDILRHKKRKLRHGAGLGMMIEPGFRGRGLGRAMMLAAIAWAEAHPGIERLELGVFAQNPGALRIYESCGFVREGVKRDWARQPSGESLDEIIMARRV